MTEIPRDNSDRSHKLPTYTQTMRDINAGFEYRLQLEIAGKAMSDYLSTLRDKDAADVLLQLMKGAMGTFGDINDRFRNDPERFMNMYAHGMMLGLHLAQQTYANLFAPEQVLHHVTQMCEVDSMSTLPKALGAYDISNRMYDQFPDEVKTGISKWRSIYDPDAEYDDLFTSGFSLIMGSANNLSAQIYHNQEQRAGEQWRQTVQHALDSSADIDWDQLLR